jgi:predicted MPP superfamily phosphohydrolase
MISPPVIFISAFVVSNLLEGSQYSGLFLFTRHFAYYLMIVGLMLFGFSLLFMLIHYAFKVRKNIIFWLIVGTTLVYALGARINGERVIVKNINLPAENINREYRFVHITDLHNGSTDKVHAQHVVDKIKPLDPEFMVITGDFIDEYHVTTDDISPFNQLDFPIFLITGNHEYYLEPGKIQEVIEGTDILLIDDMRISFEELDIIGVNELATVDLTLQTLGGINPDRYSILLDHQPKTDEAIRASENGAELMLSGHTHKGQVWPFNYLIQLGFKYVGGLYEIGDMFLYVNQGTGTLGPKMRIGSANEVTLITLEPTQ